jgi:hypothetical protein
VGDRWIRKAGSARRGGCRKGQAKQATGALLPAYPRSFPGLSTGLSTEIAVRRRNRLVAVLRQRISVLRCGALCATNVQRAAKTRAGRAVAAQHHPFAIGPETRRRTAWVRRALKGGEYSRARLSLPPRGEGLGPAAGTGRSRAGPSTKQGRRRSVSRRLRSTSGVSVGCWPVFTSASQRGVAPRRVSPVAANR